MSDAKITGFAVRVSLSKEYQTADSTFHYEFDGPVSETDAIAKHAQAFAFVEDVARKKLDEVLDRSKAEVQREVPQITGSSPVASRNEPAPAPAPAAASSGGVEFQTVPKRGGKGHIKFRPTSNLSQDALKAMIFEAIAASDGDATLHTVWDNRTGKFGIEEGHSGYGFATVNPTENNPAYPHILNDKGYPRASFYVDFNDDGTIRVTPSKAYKDAILKAQSNDSGSELPF